MYIHRSQSDSPDEFDGYSLEARTDISDSESLTRQEYADDADLNKLLARYGALPPSRPLRFGEVNDELGLLEAYNALETAQEAYARAEPEVREKFPSWQSLASALASNQFDRIMGPEWAERFDPKPAQPAAATPAP